VRAGLRATVAAAIVTASWVTLAASAEVVYPAAQAETSKPRYAAHVAPAASIAAAAPAAAVISLVEYGQPFVSLVESSLIWQLEFADVVLVTDDVVHVRSVSPLDTVVVDDEINKFDIEKVLSDFVVILDVATPFQVSEGSIADAVSAGDLIEFEFVYSLELHEGITSTLNGALLNQWVLNGNDTGDTFFASDHISLEPRKVFADSVSSSDAIASLHVQKLLADSTATLDALAYSIAKALSDSVAVIDVMSMEHNSSRELHDGVTSTINGAPLNQWALNYSDTGDWLMPSDWLAVQMGKPLTDSITASDLISLLLIQPTVLNGATLNELTLN